MRKKLLTLLLLCSATIALWAQKTVTGKMTDAETGEALIGGSVLVKGTSTGAVADIDGNFTIALPANSDVLVFSFAGYSSQELTYTGQNPFNVALTQGVELENIVVIGSRNASRTKTETAVPVDVIPVSAVINQVGQVDINQILQYMAPSFNSNRQSGSDGADHIDPATLRGLGPDQTLVLVNGKRYHQSSLVNLYGTRGRGNTGTDLNTIPASAIERIEILRDGAAAQYGSDAIAGVINIVLKGNTNTFSGNLVSGITSKGDGLNLQGNGNYGVQVGKKGFVNVTADYLQRGHTFRNAVMEDGSLYRRKFGDAEQRTFTAFLNSSFELGKDAELYVNGGYGHRMSDAYAYTRFAGAARNNDTIYPDGFDPIIQSVVKDFHNTVGIRGKLGKWNADISNTYGSNDMHYFVKNTLNASIGSKSQTRFDAGGFNLTQNTTNLDINRQFDWLSGVNIAFGGEYRNENYKIYAGEDASWRNYGLTYVDPSDNSVSTRPGGSQGFPGFQPSNVVNQDRSNAALYLDVEANITKQFMVGGAVRFENYSDFGSTTNYKVAARYAVSPKFSVRGSASTGFRAPSLAQIYFNQTFTNVISGNAVDVVLAQNGSNVTKQLGVGNLRQEKSVNFSLGFTAKPVEGLSLTIDGYMIDIKDRITLSGTFDAGSTATWGAVLRNQNIGSLQFFANALDTKSVGIDAVISYGKLFGKHMISGTLAGNYNSMTLGDIKLPSALNGENETFFGEREKRFLLASAPRTKISLMGDWKFQQFSANIRFTRFDQITLQDWAATDDIYRSKITTDLTLGYNINSNISLNIGASNLFDVYPDIQDIETETGGRYDAVQMGFNGRFMFARMRFTLK